MRDNQNRTPNGSLRKSVYGKTEKCKRVLFWERKGAEAVKEKKGRKKKENYQENKGNAVNVTY